MAPRPSEEETWTAEQLLGVKKNLRKRSVEVLIKWKGKPNSKNNWEDVENQDLDSAMLEPFEEAIETLKKNKRSVTDEEVEDKEMGKDEYVVEDILGIQWNVDTKTVEYYIKWEGWDNQYNNWEPESNCACDDLIEPYEGAAKHLKSTFGSKAKKRAGPKSRTERKAEVSDVESDDEPAERKRPGPKSKTATKRPGPKSRTAMTPEPAKRPGPKSRTSTPGPASSKRPGPKSRTAKAESSDDDEKKVTSSRKSESGSDDDAGDRNGKYKKMSDSENENDENDRGDSPPAKKRPGPKSRTSAGPASSKKKPGPKSRTAKEDSDSD